MNLKTDIDFDLKRFFQWWGKELSYCLPEKLRQKLSDKSGIIYLSITGEVLEFEQLLNGQTTKIASYNLNDSRLDNDQQLITENAVLEKAKYVLRLKPDQGIKKIIYLPAAAKENLQQVVGFELDRLTPFNAEQVYYAVKVLAKEQQGKIKLLLVLTPKDILDGLYQQLTAANVFPAVVEYSEAANDFEQDLNPYNLLPEKDKPVKSISTQIAIWGLGLISIVLMALVLIFPLWQQQQEIEGLTAQLKGLHKDTQLVQNYQLEIDQMMDETEKLISVKNKAPSLIEIIDLLSQLLPDETWLTHLKYNNAQIQVQGQSPTASALISILEASPSFSNARFVSPLTQDKKTGKERFQISMAVNSNEEVADE